MKINIAKSSGFCFGVRKAIELGHSIADGKKNVYVLGDIVHNSFVVGELAEKGVKKITRIRPVGDNPILIIRAHGAPKSIFVKAKRCGYRIADATCPMVKEIYKIGQGLEKNNKIIIIGDHNHDEVKGISGQLKKKSLIIGSPSDIKAEKLKHIRKAAVITQSTQSAENINAIMKKLSAIIPDVKLYDTTCRTTRVKQEEIKTLPSVNDVVLIIGSRSSANTKRLYQISKGINKKTFWIESCKDLAGIDTRKAASIGIMAGASTPEYITREIVKSLEKGSAGTRKRP